MASLVTLLLGIVIGWLWVGWRVSNVVIPYLDTDVDDAALDFTERLFYAVCPPGLRWWITCKERTR